MSNRFQYTFTLLRYIHDVGTNEFVNAGVIVHSPQTRRVVVRIQSSSRRAAQMFPGVNAKQYRSVLKYVRKALEQKTLRTPSMVESNAHREDALKIAQSVLPKDDSSFQWSALGSGVTQDIEKTADHLYERLVTKYEAKPKKVRRDDAEVWQPFCLALERRQLVKHLTSVEITSDADSMMFKHAWKNGLWHCLEPLSLDLLEGESIRNKARRVVGQMTALKGGERFKLYVLIGEPQHEEVKKYYNDAIKILETIPVEKVIFTESQAEDLSLALQKEILEHQTSGPLSGLFD